MTKICMVETLSFGTMLKMYPSLQREESWSAAGLRGKYDSAARVLEDWMLSVPRKPAKIRSLACMKK